MAAPVANRPVAWPTGRAIHPNGRVPPPEEARPRQSRRVARTGPWDGRGSAVDAACALRQVGGDGVEDAHQLSRLGLVEVVARRSDLLHGLVRLDRWLLGRVLVSGDRAADVRTL